uniref:CCDC66 domain-containing protein n=1 Tax=Salarias fasciatus TaxID=181472 RepID=A0A672GLM0_SALFA
MGERESDSRAAIDAKKAQWRKDLDEQVAQKQQRPASSRLQAEEDADSLASVRSSLGHREPPAAIRSSLRLGEFTPMEEVQSLERREEQRRRWLEELDRQREEATERRRREKLQQKQTEDLDLWASHFDSMQPRRPPVQPERGDWEPSSSLSLVWEAESVGGASVDTAGGHTSRTSYLRTMTSLLDPAQMEERERRRLKQLEQQRAIEAQIEERRQQREREEARRRREEEEEDRRVALERELLHRQYELEAQRHKQKLLSHGSDQDQPEKDHKDKRLQETQEPDPGKKQPDCLEDGGGSSSHRDAAVQTEAAVSTLDVPHGPLPVPPPAPAPPDGRSRAARSGKENIYVAAGGDPYQPFARAERSRRDKRRPEWNTQRPSRRFVPASERYPVTLQKNRQESRLKRQAELLALQERSSSRDRPPSPSPAPGPPALLQTRPPQEGTGSAASSPVTAAAGFCPLSRVTLLISGGS